MTVPCMLCPKLEQSRTHSPTPASHIPIPTCTYMYVCIYMYIHVGTCTYTIYIICMYVRMSVNVHERTYICTVYTCTYM